MTAPKNAPKAPVEKDEGPTIAGLSVLHNLKVEDNTDADDLPEEAPVEESERPLTSGLTQVDYV
jgi:hypothetical protein